MSPGCGVLFLICVAVSAGFKLLPGAAESFTNTFAQFAEPGPSSRHTERLNFLLGLRADSGAECSIRKHLRSSPLYDPNVLYLITELLDAESFMTSDTIRGTHIPHSSLERMLW